MDAWFAGKQLGHDWASQHYELWRRTLVPFVAKPVKVLEVGSWEGRSALWFLGCLPQATITCVDLWQQGGLFDGWCDMAEVERRFDANLEPLASRVRKIKQTSHAALIDLGLAGSRFDVIYVDGSHVARDVWGDAVLAWPMLQRDGVLIFDDYRWGGAEQGSMGHPMIAIDAFLTAYRDHVEVLHKDYQVVVRRVTEAQS